MPPLEAMKFNTPVLTTKKASVPEVTGGLVNYVDNPNEQDEYILRIRNGFSIPDKKKEKELFDKYDIKHAARQYVELMKR